MASIKILTLCAAATVLLTLTFYATALPNAEPEPGQSSGHLNRPADTQRFGDVEVEETRIYYVGSHAPPGEFPHQILVKALKKVTVDRVEYVACGGSIISERWILTAAHCIVDEDNKVRPFSAFSIIAGALSSVEPWNVGAVKHKIVKVVAHPSYLNETERRNLKQDLALLKIDKTANFNKDIHPVKLADTDFVATGDALVSGWGVTKSENASHLLLKYIVPIFPNDQCSHHEEWNGDLNVCAGGGKEFNKGFCIGDIGGPLTQNGILVGVVSGAGHCGDHNKGIYARVSAAREWIKEISQV